MRNAARPRRLPAGGPGTALGMLLAGAVALGACGSEAERWVPPSSVSDRTILADTAKRDKVDFEGVRGGG